jgi:hypothetical protein
MEQPGQQLLTATRQVFGMEENVCLIQCIHSFLCILLSIFLFMNIHDYYIGSWYKDTTLLMKYGRTDAWKISSRKKSHEPLTYVSLKDKMNICN